MNLEFKILNAYALMHVEFFSQKLFEFKVTVHNILTKPLLQNLEKTWIATILNKIDNIVL